MAKVSFTVDTGGNGNFVAPDGQDFKETLRTIYNHPQASEISHPCVSVSIDGEWQGRFVLPEAFAADADPDSTDRIFVNPL